MSAPIETMRAFIALNLDIGAVRRVAEVARQLRESPRAPKARWVAPTKMHVTLKFFGTIDVGLAPALAAEIRLLAEGRPAPHVAVNELTAFPSPEHARVIVASVDDPEGGVARLAAAVEERSAELGFPRESRAFRGHLTLARTVGSVDARAWLSAVPISAFDAVGTELVLYRSDLARSGAEYTAVARYGFAPASARDGAERKE